jgi:hypothetical protein
MKTSSLPGPAVLLRPLKTADWLHWSIILLVFSITGTLSVVLSRFLLHNVLHLEGGLLSGPWPYRIAYLVLVPPFYSVTLVMVGTLFGKHVYFRRRVLRMWGLLLPSGIWSLSKAGSNRNLFLHEP